MGLFSRVHNWLSALILLISAFSLTLAAQDGCVQGKVIDPDGTPVPSTYVIAFEVDRSASHGVGTDSEGMFLLDRLPAGEYDVIACNEYVPGSPSIGPENEDAHVRTRLVEGHVCSSVSLRQPRRARLRLRATNAVTQESIKPIDATFRLNAEEIWRGTANEQQELLVPVNAGLQVQVFAPGYENSDVLQISPLQPGEVRDLAVALRPVAMGCVSGTVVDAEAAALQGVRLQLDPISHGAGSQGIAFSDENGHFQFDQVQPGHYVIFAHADGYPLPGGVDGADAGAAVPPGRSCSDVSIKLGPKAAKLSVEVIDAVTRKPIKGAEAWAGAGDSQNAWTLRMVADPMPVPALTSFEVNASAPGYAKAEPLNISPLQPEEAHQVIIALQRKAE